MKLTDKQRKGLAAIMALNVFDIARRSPGNPILGSVALDYRRYLALRLLHPDREIVPTGGRSREVDKIWHMHILDTRRYHTDCQAIFGEYLHHAPGVLPDKTSARLYRDTFIAGPRGKPDPALAPFLYGKGESPPSDDDDDIDCA